MEKTSFGNQRSLGVSKNPELFTWTPPGREKERDKVMIEPIAESFVQEALGGIKPGHPHRFLEHSAHQDRRE